MLALAMALQHRPEAISRLMHAIDFGALASGGWAPLSLARRYGLNDGDYAAEMLARWVEDAPLGLSADATFEALHEANERWAAEHPQAARELHVFAANLNTSSVQRFSRACTPEVRLVDAVRASMSIPLLYEAVEIGGHIFVDGGAIYNYPVTAFDFDEPPCHTLDASTEGASPEPDPGTLGFYFTPLIEDNGLEWGAPIHFLTALVEATNQSAHLKIASNARVRDRTITIDSGGIATTAFDLSEDEKQTLWRNGLEATCAFFDRPVPEDARWE
jgi:NTE family protein